MDTEPTHQSEGPDLASEGASGPRQDGHHSVRPDQVIPPGKPADVAPVRDLVRDVALFLPNLVKLLTRLIRDPRVPRRSKLLIGGLVVYLASPLDIIPDVVPVVGMADDVLLAVYGVKHLIDKAGEDVVLEHWDGPRDLLDLVHTVLDAVGSMVPAPVRKWIDRLSG